MRGYSQIFNGFLLHYSFARIQTATQEVFYIVWCVCWCDFGKKNTGVLFKGIYSIVFLYAYFKSTNEAIANICSSCVCGRTLDFPVLFFSYVRQKNRVFFFFSFTIVAICANKNALKPHRWILYIWWWRRWGIWVFLEMFFHLIFLLFPPMGHTHPNGRRIFYLITIYVFFFFLKNACKWEYFSIYIFASARTASQMLPVPRANPYERYMR